MSVLFSLSLIVLSLIGMADASFITWEKLNNQIPPCGPGFDCGAVLSSPHAEIAGIPLSVYGMAFYLTVFVLGLAQYLDFDLKKHLTQQRKPWSNLEVIDVLQVVTSFGFLFSLYLVYLMGAVIDAWCKYCLISAGTSTTLFIITTWYRTTYRSTNHPLDKVTN